MSQQFWNGHLMCWWQQAWHYILKKYIYYYWILFYPLLWLLKWRTDKTFVRKKVKTFFVSMLIEMEKIMEFRVSESMKCRWFLLFRKIPNLINVIVVKHFEEKNIINNMLKYSIVNIHEIFYACCNTKSFAIITIHWDWVCQYPEYFDFD